VDSQPITHSSSTTTSSTATTSSASSSTSSLGGVGSGGAAGLSPSLGSEAAGMRADATAADLAATAQPSHGGELGGERAAGDVASQQQQGGERPSRGWFSRSVLWLVGAGGGGRSDAEPEGSTGSESSAVSNGKGSSASNGGALPPDATKAREGSGGEAASPQDPAAAATGASVELTQ
jgi:hypothetical protein